MFKKILVAVLFLCISSVSLVFAVEVVVDNAALGFNLNGEWSCNTASVDKFGADYWYTLSTSAKVTSVAIWQPTLPVAGAYQVWVWYPQGPNRVIDAQYLISHDAGVSCLYTNQTIHGGQWCLLGTFRFSAGTTGSVKLTNYSQENGKAVLADAVKFVSFSPPVMKSGGEFRAFWAYTWGASMLTPTQCTAMIDTARRYNYNAVFAEVRKCGDAYYKSTYEPWADNITPANFDILSTIIDYAHDTSDGKPYIEVHAWMVTYRDWVTTATTSDTTHHIFWTHPEWFTKSYTGETAAGNAMFLDPAIPEVQDYLAKIYLDVVKHYNVDGIHYDYVRYPESGTVTGSTFGYNDIVCKRFQQEYGYAPPTSTTNWSLWTTWGQYRRDAILALLKKVYANTLELNPNMKVTGSFVTWLPFDPVFTKTRPYYEAFSDWVSMTKEHTVDAAIPMAYFREHVSAQSTGFRGWVDLTMNNRYGRHAYIGTGSYLNDTAANLNQMLYIRNAHADGLVNYSYNDMDSTNNLSPAVMFDLTSTYIFPTTTHTPGMSWKSAPTTGLLKGQVYSSAVRPKPYYNGKVVYRARIVAKNETTLSEWTTTTDGTGFYAFIDLPPGNYTVTAYPPRTYSRKIEQSKKPVRVDSIRVYAGLVTNVEFNFARKKFSFFLF
jgi:uncharacterized lipoprotein YddW (UPF0748 family)